MKIAVLGNITLDFIARDFRKAGDEVYLAPGFDAWRQETLDQSSGLHLFDPDAVLLVIEGGASAEDVMRLKNGLPRAKTVVPDLENLANETPGFYDDRMRRLAAMPFSLSGLRTIEDEFRFAILSSPKKILAVDADNTLWDGIISEDGSDRVKPFGEFQKGILGLSARGVLLALLSKNDPPQGGSPIVSAFSRPDMPLSLGDFSAVGVNWSPKAGNLLEICRSLNLGTDSVVFIDDNPHERAQMKAHLPEVTVVPFPDDLRKPAQFLRRLNDAFFNDVGGTNEDKARVSLYRDEAVRRDFAARAESVDDYLKGLKLKCLASRATADDVPRLAQMAGKTNQFNATTIRRDAAQFSELIADGGKRVWTFRASDAFGDMGIVCYVIYDCASRRVTDFVMSCRAMGRTLEHFAINTVRSELAAEGMSVAGIDFVPTAKNAPIKTFLDALDLSLDQKTFFNRIYRN